MQVDCGQCSGCDKEFNAHVLSNVPDLAKNAMLSKTIHELLVPAKSGPYHWSSQSGFDRSLIYQGLVCPCVCVGILLCGHSTNHTSATRFLVSSNIHGIYLGDATNSIVINCDT